MQIIVPLLTAVPATDGWKTLFLVLHSSCNEKNVKPQTVHYFMHKGICAIFFISFPFAGVFFGANSAAMENISHRKEAWLHLWKKDSFEYWVTRLDSTRRCFLLKHQIRKRMILLTSHPESFLTLQSVSCETRGIRIEKPRRKISGKKKLGKRTKGTFEEVFNSRCFTSYPQRNQQQQTRQNIHEMNLSRMGSSERYFHSSSMSCWCLSSFFSFSFSISLALFTDCFFFSPQSHSYEKHERNEKSSWVCDDEGSNATQHNGSEETEPKIGNPETLKRRWW